MKVLIIESFDRLLMLIMEIK